MQPQNTESIYSWRKEPWAKLVPYRLSEHLDHFEADDGKPPTIQMALAEARYIVNLHFEGGTVSSESLSGLHGPEGIKEAEQTIRECKAFIRDAVKLIRASPEYHAIELQWTDAMKLVHSAEAGSSPAMLNCGNVSLKIQKSKADRLQFFVNGDKVSRNVAWNKLVGHLFHE